METMAQAPHEDQVVEVTEKAKRRQHSAAYKLKILQEADACQKPGELAALLRREGLYSSHLAAWRKARAKGERKGLEAQRRGPAPRVADERDQKLAEQAREVASWKARAELAEALVEVQKKVAGILGITLPENGGKRS
jgi:transposase InsO family protein